MLYVFGLSHEEHISADPAVSEDTVSIFLTFQLCHLMYVVFIH